MPFSPAYRCMRVNGARASPNTERTDEPTGILFTWFGAPANVAYSLYVGGLKAQLIALKYDEAVLNPKAQGGDDALSVYVIICVLNDLQQKVGLFVVEVIGQPTREGCKVKSVGKVCKMEWSEENLPLESAL
jgi:hypothetical protein